MKFNQFYSRLLFVGCILLFSGVVESKNSRRLCGFHLSQKVLYDPSIQECKDGTVVPRATISTLPASWNRTQVCGRHGSPKALYDPSVEDCVEGTVVPRTTTSIFPSKSSSTPTPTRSCDEELIARGYKCCGPTPWPTFQKAYHPDFETCCREMNNVKVYQNSPEKDNICCETRIYPRNNPGCRHPALNDRLWNTQNLDERAYDDLCSAEHIYLTKVIRKRGTIILRPVKPKGKRFELPFETDGYTPTTRLPKKGILLVTIKDQSKANEFIALGNDKFYIVTRKRKFVRRVLRRWCLNKNDKRLQKKKNKFA